MPRNGSGLYNLPAGNPVADGTLITSNWANSTLNDVASALTASVTADGQTPFTGALKVINGAVSSPSITFNSETTTGIYRPAVNNIAITVGGNEKIKFDTTSAYLSSTLNTTQPIVSSSTFQGTSIKTGSGSVGAPAYSFIGDTASGLFSPTAGQLQLSVSGTGRITVDGSNTTFATHIIPAANNTYSLGNASYKFLSVQATTFNGVATNAQYADLAERYESDKNYPAGTVLEFGGDYEVTLAEENSNRVAGVVSTAPGFLMNSEQEGLSVPVALTGRVPCKVKGKISKGDMLVSAGNGYARSEANPAVGTIVGKALADFNGAKGTIEVAVGRY